MAYGKTKTFIVTSLIAAMPIGVLWHENGKLRDHVAARRTNDDYGLLSVILPPSEVDTDGSPEERQPTKSTHSRESNNRAEEEKRLPSVEGLDGEGNVFPLPFEDLRSLNPNALTKEGTLHDQMVRLLRMSEDEASRLDGSLKDSRERIWEYEKENTEVVSVSDDEQIYRIAAFPEFGQRVKEEAAAEFRDILGDDRAEFFEGRVFDHYDANKKFGDFGSKDRTITFRSLDHERIYVSVESQDPNEQRKTTMASTYKELPEEYRHLFQTEPVEGE